MIDSLPTPRQEGGGEAVVGFGDSWSADAADVVVHGVFEDEVPLLDSRSQRLAELCGFTGDHRTWSASLDRDDHTLTVLIGLGARAGIDAERLRRCAALTAMWAHPGHLIDVHLAADTAGEVGTEMAVRTVADGLLTAVTRLEPAAGPTPLPVRHRLTAVPASPDLRRALALAHLTAESVTLTRDLVNAAPGALTPAAMAAIAADIADREGLAIRVLDVAGLRGEAMGGLLAIGRGADAEPRFVELGYRPPTAVRRVALVGKGITFDSGGLSLKAPDAMMDMKMDMAGAAAVLGVMSVIARADMPVAVDAYLPLAENMPGPAAVRVGEVITTRSGLTVEVRNTDFEGRVVLADALSRASQGRPDLIVDLATLTDACTVALGDDIAGLFSNDDTAATAAGQAARTAGEPVWRLPLDRRYTRHLRSDVADLSNHPGNRTGRAITAALFLEQFVDPGIPWVHMDMVGPAWRADGESRGATGFGVRTLLRLVENLAAP